MSALLEKYITKYLSEYRCDVRATIKELSSEYYKIHKDHFVIEKNLDILILLLNRHSFKNMLVLTVIRLKELYKDDLNIDEIDSDYLRTQQTMTKMETLLHLKSKHKYFIPLFVITMYGFL